jgi:hypothetical protein
MIFTQDGINGEWWISRDGKKRLENFDVIERNGRRIRIQRQLDYDYRIYLNRSDGSDTKVITPDSLELWNDPMEGEPESADDWRVESAEMVFDIDTGMVEMAVSSVKIPLDWESSKVISNRELL